VFLTGTGLSLDPSRTATFFAAELARQHGRRVVVDLDYRPVLWPAAEAYGATIRPLIAQGDVVIGTEEEVVAASGSSDAVQGALRLLERHPSLLVVKRGGAGARVYEPDGTVEEVPPFKVNVLNVLGAGDAFASGFLYGYLEGWRPAKAARFGNATGAIIVTRHGCANFMPTLNEVRSFLVEHGETALLATTA
jgi:5-dehydro-2-deoxygluconokinase